MTEDRTKADTHARIEQEGGQEKAVALGIKRPILCIDFDGVINSYKSGWKGEEHIPDPPTEGVFEFLYSAVQDFEVHIFSSRSKTEGGIQAMKKYLTEWNQRLAPPHTELGLIVNLVHWPKEKPPAHVLLDDRAITFEGVFPSMETLKAFRPWYLSDDERCPC